MDPPNADDGANAAPKKPVAPGELEVNAWLQKMEAKEQWFSVYKKAQEVRARAIDGQTTLIVVEFPTNLSTMKCLLNDALITNAGSICALEWQRNTC